MFLKSLTLRGFKTFADSTEIELGPGDRITAIVGPNGCGKSNLLDATRWVLGEDNPRHLRVANLPDIIFAGTTRRKPLSLAEVTLLFDNSSAKLPVPFTEVAIRRRTFREGESEFFINKNLCRLKDIKDLLLDTGLGEGTYSIITQGQVDAILSSKGEERRAVFEEAAGINKYKTRKLAAEKKLIAAEQNILRVNDLKVEVGEHLLTLEEQAHRAREYLDLQAKVKETEIGLCKKILENLLERKAKLEGQLAESRKMAEEKVAEELKDEEELIKLKETLRRTEIEIDEHFMKLDAEKDRLRDLEINRRFVEGELKREENLCRDLETKKEELQKRIGSLRAKDSGGAAFEAAGTHFDDTISLLIAQARHLIETLSAISAFFGMENTFSVVGKKDLEASINLQLELLQEESKRVEAEMERVRFWPAGPPAGTGKLGSLGGPRRNQGRSARKRQPPETGKGRPEAKDRRAGRKDQKRRKKGAGSGRGDHRPGDRPGQARRRNAGADGKALGRIQPEPERDRNPPLLHNQCG